MSEFTKEYCALVVNHALSKAWFEGKTQQQVADEIGKDAGGLSRAKSGKQNLGVVAINTLVENYGTPKVSSGHYLQGILIDDFKSFIKHHQEIHNEIYHQELVIWFNNDEVREYLVKLLSSYHPEDLSRDPTCTLFHKVQTARKKPTQSLTAWVDAFIKSSDFSDWYNEASESIKLTPSTRSYYLTCHTLTINGYSKSMSHHELANLITLAYFIKNVDPSFSLLNISHPKNEYPISEMVITGDVIDDYYEAQLSKEISVQIPVGFSFDGLSFSNNSPAFRRDILLSNFVRSVSVDLYLNEKMEYRIVICEPTQAFTRTFVINHVHGLELFETYNEVRKFYGLPISDLSGLKRSIAEKGGYIPGALVL
ncbi:MAG: transcriptional regulator with XRE-family HTH domain [Colwellia sp.]|jgi:transcriptional regulator with XRE-family HTH domain